MAGRYSNTNNHFDPNAMEGPDGREEEGGAYDKESSFLTERWSPGSVGTLHKWSDLDSSQLSQHHTLGPGHNQASPGDHIHDGGLSKNLGQWVNWPAASTSWLGGTTNPSIGTLGNIEGKYVKVGTMVTYRFTCVAGTDTTFGSGGWTFRLPFQALNPLYNAMAAAIGSCHGFQSGNSNFVGSACLADANSVFLVGNSASTWQSNVPATWAANSGNVFGFQVTYESKT